MTAAVTYYLKINCLVPKSIIHSSITPNALVGFEPISSVPEKDAMTTALYIYSYRVIVCFHVLTAKSAHAYF
jgi:hypothetical protein